MTHVSNDLHALFAGPLCSVGFHAQQQTSKNMLQGIEQLPS